TVTAGTLLINGPLPNSAITVDSNGTLGGVGPILSADVSGTLAPGNSIGTLSANFVNFNASSTFEVELDNTSSDLVHATGMPGPGVTIYDGATLTIVPIDFTHMSVPYYTIITGAGGVNLEGSSDPFRISPSTDFIAKVEYQENNVFLFVTPTNVAPAGPCFASLFNEGNPEVIALFDILSAQTPNALRNSFVQMEATNFNNIADYCFICLLYILFWLAYYFYILNGSHSEGIRLKIFVLAAIEEILFPSI
ncbi:MAG: hypothetical protein NTZ86_08755, partial [Legionellales bacterium]|nr:hypothetical protein [Legionellales bacterium]